MKLSLHAFAATSLAAVPAHADDTAKAKAAFTEGLALEQSSDFAGALAPDGHLRRTARAL